MCAKNTATRRKSTGYDRFGYRPSPDPRQHDQLFDHQKGAKRRRDLLDSIQFDRLQRRWRAENKEIRRQGWEGFGNTELPIDKYKHDIMKMIASNRISLLAGETGSGKSTQLAQYALEMGYDHIVYLQPRRVIVDSIAERLDEELSAQFEQKALQKPDHLVGMAHSDHATMRDDTVIQVMTSAVFKKRAPQLREEWKDKKILIVADEVHEGNIETEFAVATAAELMTEQDTWNMVLMSATLNEEEIQQAYTPINGRPIPKIEVEGRPHLIEYNESPDMNVVEVYDEECKESKKTLIFTDGKRSIGAIADELRRRHPELRIQKLHAKISEDERRAIFHAEDDGVETVIISTSAGQSGLTIPGVDRVISDGWTKSPELDGENASGLPRVLCSKAQLTQQMGRGGRDVDGAKFFLARPLPLRRRFSDDEYADAFVQFGDREEHIPADIYHSVITRNVLSAAAMDRDFYNLNEYLIHKVTKATIDEAYTVLRLLGAVDEQNEVTAIGREMDKYPLRPELARAVAEIASRGTLLQKQQIAAICAAIESGGLGSFDPQKLKSLQGRLSTETQDDFTAELDYFMGSLKFIHTEVGTLSVFVHGQLTGLMPDVSFDSVDDDLVIKAGFDVQNVIRAHKQYRKICRYMGIEDSDMYTGLTNTLTSSERTELHNVLLTGMPHLLYEEVARRKWRGRSKREQDGTKTKPLPKVWYRNVLGPEKKERYPFDRTISTRSVMGSLAIGSSELIAGYPRWYIDDDGETHNVIERGLRTTKQAVRKALGRSALSIKEETDIGPDGRLRQIHTGMIGRMRTHRSVERGQADNDQKVNLFVQSALEKPGPAQRELRHLKKQLENLAQRIPANRISYFFDKTPITQADLIELVATAARGVSSLGELDATLRELMRERAMTLHSYISNESIEVIEENMPSYIEIHGWPYDVRYEGPEAMPYITGFSLDHAGSLPDRLTIRDGREVLFRYSYGDMDEYRDLTASDVKEMKGIAL